MSEVRCIRCDKIIPDGYTAMHSLAGAWHIHCTKSDIPERVFIQQYEDATLWGFQSGQEVTWCVDRVNEHDVEYVNIKENHRLKKEVEELVLEMANYQGAQCDKSRAYFQEKLKQIQEGR